MGPWAPFEMNLYDHNVQRSISRRDEKTLYQSVYEDLLGKIQSGEYPVGSRLPAQPQLCSVYGVSTITIRRALDMLSTDGLVRRRRRVGTTVISDGSVSSASPVIRPVIGVVMTSFDDTFGTQVLEGLLDEAFGRAHILLERTTGDRDKEAAAIASVREAGAQALILLPCSSAFVPPAVLSLLAEGFPVVIVDRRFEGVPVAAVATDNISAAAEATTRLYELGHKRVALITADGRVTSNDDRRRGWVAASAQRGISLDGDLGFHGVESTLPGATVGLETDVEHLKGFISSHPGVTGYVVGEYNIALLLRDALTQLGQRIPKDASVICFDHPRASFDRELPFFTHVEQDQAGIGALAVRSALDQIHNGANADKQIVTARLIEGSSTAPLKSR